jgi:hypothetical protein
MPVTALYAALLTPLFIFLSLRVINMRREARAALGDGGNAELLRRVRVQANFAEYAPLALILLGLAESLHAPEWTLHFIGLLLLAGRLFHAVGVSQAKEQFRFRVTGMILTFATLSCGAMLCLFQIVALRFSLR